MAPKGRRAAEHGKGTRLTRRVRGYTIARMMRIPVLAPFIGLAACASADPFPLPDAPPAQQGTSLLDQSLVPVQPAQTVLDQFWTELREAHADFVASPDDAEAQIWLGRRLAYLGYYRRAIEVYADGFAKHPEDARFLRHRGHRYISVRELDAAIEDLALAAKLVQNTPDEVEPDGRPNERGIPTSTLQSNIWYHLGLAQYLQGDFQRALSSYRQDLELNRGPDGVVAASYWLYLIHRRLGNAEEADAVLEAVTAEMDIIENHSYHQLLLMFKGETAPEAMLQDARGADALQNATLGYGIGAWYLINGEEDRAFEIFNDILTSPQWASFGYIAAEAEVARRGTR